MAKETIKVLIEGGKATAAPPLGPALGPIGLNIGQVVTDINKKTTEFKGMQVPVEVIVDSDTKAYEIKVGTPPCSALIKQEAGIDKGASNPKQEKVADLRIEQAIKIAIMKQDSLLGKTRKEQVKEVIGTCNSMGIMVEGVSAKEAIELVNQGKFDEKITKEKTELSAEELKEIEEEKKKLAEELEKRRVEFETKAKEIIESMKGKERGAIKAKLVEAEVPQKIIDELLPAEEAEAAAKPKEATEAPKEEAKK
jgi:large subunit ribosomal protein L11